MVKVLYRLAFAIVVMLAIWNPAYTQQGVPTTAPVIPSNIKTAAVVDVPQVNPVIHHITGLKILILLRRKGMKVAPLSDEILMADAAQTSIAAGFSLGDGSIVARLPRAELEVSDLPRTAPSASGTALGQGEVPAKLLFIQRDGKNVVLRFMGLDGGTGLSLLDTNGLPVPAARRDAREETLVPGQHVHIMAPARVPQADGFASSELFVNIEDIEGILVKISRTPAGNVTRLTIAAEKMSPSILGGIAVNDAGETIGLIETTNGNEAQLIPVLGVRRAVARIRLGFESKPQPWLGARGTSIATITLEQLAMVGWTRANALNLIARQIGVVLTSVPPQTPAWHANLRVGDVVTRMNGSEITSAEEFSSQLMLAGVNTPVRFTVMGPVRRMPRIVSVRLVESLNPVRAMEAAEERELRRSSSDPFISRGIEAVTMTSEVATRLKAPAGLFVSFVHESSAASRAGLQAGDVIVSVNKQLLLENEPPVSFPGTIILDIVRNGQKLELLVHSDRAPFPPAKR